MDARIKISAYQLSSGQFLQFSGDYSYYGGNDHATKVQTTFECGEYRQPQIICAVFTQKAGL